jgi:hypothetical protein
MTTITISTMVIHAATHTGDLDCFGMIPHFGHFSVRDSNFSAQFGQIFMTGSG